MNAEADNKLAYEEPPMSPDVSFKGSDAHALNGLTLEPYTPRRMWAADAMGLRWGKLSEGESQQLNINGTYPGLTSDIPIVIWVCTLSEEETRIVRANPASYDGKLAEFAVEHKLVHMRQSAWRAARKVFFKIMDEVHEAYGEPEGAEKKTASPE